MVYGIPTKKFLLIIKNLIGFGFFMRCYAILNKLVFIKCVKFSFYARKRSNFPEFWMLRRGTFAPDALLDPPVNIYYTWLRCRFVYLFFFLFKINPKQHTTCLLIGPYDLHWSVNVRQVPLKKRQDWVRLCFNTPFQNRLKRWLLSSRSAAGS